MQLSGGCHVTGAGQRSKEYTRLFSFSGFANSVGPALAIIVFLATGNEWSEQALRARSAADPSVRGLLLHVVRCRLTSDAISDGLGAELNPFRC